MSYRPITDVWILARPKVRYYGAYPNGFLERAKALLGVTSLDPVLHVCGGMAKQYPAWQKLCRNDKTLDLDAATGADFVQPVDVKLPNYLCPDATCLDCVDGDFKTGEQGHPWRALIADPPYTEADADHYAPGRAAFPQANAVLRAMLAAVRPGGRVGMLHYIVPQPPREGVKFVACAGVFVGFNNRIRCFSVFEKVVLPDQETKDPR